MFRADTGTSACGDASPVRDCEGEYSEWCEKRPFWRHFMLKTIIILPGWDRHRETAQK
jgi:hypothetical protein